MPRSRAKGTYTLSEPRPFALKNQIEAILYLKGEPVDLANIAALAQCRRDEVQEAVSELMEDYAHRDSALEVIAVEDGFALQLRDPFRELASEILPPELGVGAMRTLATIILRGPLSQADLVELRGPGAYQHVAELAEKGFITKHRQPGNRSFWLKVTDKFHHYFSVDELAAEAAKDPESLADPEAAQKMDPD